MNTNTTGPFGYRATRADDGTLTIHDVPIFVECERGDRKFDREWLAEAFRKAKQAEGEGYLPPLHVRHHVAGVKLSDDVRAAGFFRLTRSGPITFKGETRQALFADLVVTDPSVREEILAKRLPYRSVEILDVEAPAIDSLALLDHEAPYLELPMLMVSNPHKVTGDGAKPAGLVASATFANPWLARDGAKHEPVLAFFQRGHSAHFLTEDPNMTTTNAKFEKDEKDEKDEKSKKDGMYEKEGAPEGGSEMKLDVAALVKAIQEGSISVADMEAILAAIESQKSAMGPSKDAPSAPATAPGESMKNADASELFARISGENAALRARLDDRDAADKRREDVAAALKRLAGRPLGSDLETKLAAFHREHGAKAFGTHVDAIAQTFGALPGDGGADAAARFAAQGATTPKEALAFTDAGPDAVSKASHFAREWDDLNSRGHVRMSKDRYVDLNMARAGVSA